MDDEHEAGILALEKAAQWWHGMLTALAMICATILTAELIAVLGDLSHG